MKKINYVLLLGMSFFSVVVSAAVSDVPVDEVTSEEVVIIDCSLTPDEPECISDEEVLEEDIINCLEMPHAPECSSIKEEKLPSINQ